MIVIVALLTVPFYELKTLPYVFTSIAMILILAHLPLFNAALPPIIHALLLELLSLARIDFIFNYGGPDNGELMSNMSDPFVAIRVGCGYMNGYSKVITVIVFTFILLSIAQIVLSHSLLKDNAYITRVKMSNGLLRALYMLYIIVGLSILINLDSSPFF